MTKTIQIAYAPDGSVVIEAEGFSGTECLDATKALEIALKLQSPERKMKRGDEGHEPRTKLRNRTSA